jgi:hypothetical protein
MDVHARTFFLRLAARGVALLTLGVPALELIGGRFDYETELFDGFIESFAHFATLQLHLSPFVEHGD